MRTKTLLLTAALAVAGTLSSMAQVYSVNAVGYVNVNVPPGFSMIANPLNASTNTITALFGAAPDGTVIYKFNPATGTYTSNLKDFGEWSIPNDTLVPGEGAFIRNNGTQPFTVTFVGEVMQGNLTNAIPNGFSIKSSMVPQSGQLDTVLGFPAVDGDTIYRFNNTTGTYTSSVRDFGEWSTNPVPAVGESFFVFKNGAATWTRQFSVN
jgi:hypothetical protein